MTVSNSENERTSFVPNQSLSDNVDIEQPVTFDDDGSTGDNIDSKSKIEDEDTSHSLPIIDCASSNNLRRLLKDAAKNTRHSVQVQASPHSNTRVVKNWTSKTTSSLKDRDLLEWSSTLLPCVRWLRSYKYSENLITDICAGLTVGIMIVPQSMSYAKLAGLPVEYGLYSAFLPVYAYAMFGSSRQLAVGPVALVSLMLSTGLTAIVTGEEVSGGHRALAGGGGASYDLTPEQQETYNMLAVQTAFLVGVTYIVMGVFRLGFVTIFLSHAVISGFTTGAAVMIGMSQVKFILGYDVERSSYLHDLLGNIFSNIEEFNYKTFILGMSNIIALVALKNIGKSYPKFKSVRALGPLLVSGASILAAFAFDLEDKGIPIISSIPRGLPPFSVDVWFPVIEFNKLIVVVISVAIVGFMESIAIAKQLASKHKYELDSSQELIGLGMANLAGAMFQSYPVTGSFSRSAVNNESGAKSGISGIVTATLVMIVLLFLTTVFEYIPLATLAAIVISGVLGLLDHEEAIFLWKVHKLDFSVWMISFLGTMFLGVEVGLLIAVGVSILLVMYESAYPHTAMLGRLPGTTVYRNVKQYPDAEMYEGIMLCRIDAPIYFANTQHIREKISKYEVKAAQQTGGTNFVDAISTASLKQPIHYIIVDFSPVSHIDSSAIHILNDMNKNYKNKKVQLCICNPSKGVMAKLVSSGLTESIGEDYIFVSMHDAVNACLNELSKAEEEGSLKTLEDSGDDTGGKLEVGTVDVNGDKEHNL